MAKRMKLGLEGLRVNETEYLVLEHIIGCSRREHVVGCEFVSISRKQLAEAIGRTSLTTWRACRHLESEGLVEMRDEHLGSGAQMANSYRATAIGIEVARLCRMNRADGDG